MTLLQIILNLQMRLILEVSTNCRRKNLLISNKVAVIILNKYSDASFRNIILIKYNMPNKPPQYCYINLVYTVYILLYYVLLFPYSNTGWH